MEVSFDVDTSKRIFSQPLQRSLFGTITQRIFSHHSSCTMAFSYTSGVFWPC